MAYYAMVRAGLIENSTVEWDRFSQVLAKARFAGLIPLEAISDPISETLDPSQRGVRLHYDELTLRDLMHGIKSHPVHTGEKSVQLWIEKRSMWPLFLQTALPLGISVHLIEDREPPSSAVGNALKNTKKNIPTTVLTFGDFGDEPWRMDAAYYVLAEQIRKKDHLSWRRCTITEAQIEQHKLPLNPDSFEFHDGKWVSLYGRKPSAELEAFHPEELQKLIREEVRQGGDAGAVQKDTAKAAA